jgi:hypothetical protein
MLSLHIWFVFEVRSRSKGRKRKTKTRPTFVSWSAVFDYLSWASQAIVFDGVTIAECKSAEPWNLLITGLTNKYGLFFFFCFARTILKKLKHSDSYTGGDGRERCSPSRVWTQTPSAQGVRVKTERTCEWPDSNKPV